VLVAGVGIAVDDWIGGVFPKIAGGLLLVFGGYYLVQHLRGKGHGHTHFLGGHGPGRHQYHDHGHEHDHGHGHAHASAAVPVVPPPIGLPAARSDRAVVLGLVALLTFSPCEGFLPVYVSGVAYGWAGFALLTVVLAMATLAGMVTFTWLTLAGLNRFRIDAIERYEGALLGGLLCVLGVLVLVLES
jgi:nickel/cobalt exporter